MTDTTTPTLDELLGECRDYISDAVRDAMNAYGPESLGVIEGETLLAQIDACGMDAAKPETLCDDCAAIVARHFKVVKP